MQRVFHQYRNRSRLFGMIESLYAYISDFDYMFEDEQVLWLDESFKPLCDILQERLLQFRSPIFKKFDLPNVYNTFTSQKNWDTKCKEVTVCLSGGKDSAATALYFKNHGYRVHLYHAAGVNKAYGDEKKAAQSIADYLGCDLFIDTFNLSGTHQYIEHPLKNYIIANGALHYAMAKGYAPVLSFGNFYKSTLDMNEFEVCGGDCIEMWFTYADIIRTIIPDFEIKIPLATNGDTFDILKTDWKLFTLAVSCMSPYRFRAHWKHRTEQTFGLRLFDNRCGCCWKCCTESIWLMDVGKMEYNEEYYKHCLGVQISAILKENDEKVDVEGAWNNYMFYPIEKSHAMEFIDYKVRHSCDRASKLIAPEGEI